jgi:hypothetical protein
MREVEYFAEIREGRCEDALPFDQRGRPIE